MSATKQKNKIIVIRLYNIHKNLEKLLYLQKKTIRYNLFHNKISLYIRCEKHFYNLYQLQIINKVFKRY